MTWGPTEWLQWAESAKTFFSRHGMVVKKFVVPMDKEGEFFMAGIEKPDKHPEIDPLADSLLGVKMMFTPKLNKTFLFLVENDRGLD